MKLFLFIFIWMVGAGFGRFRELSLIALIHLIASMVLWAWMEEYSEDYSDVYLFLCRFVNVLNLLLLLQQIWFFIRDFFISENTAWMSRSDGMPETESIFGA